MTQIICRKLIKIDDARTKIIRFIKRVPLLLFGGTTQIERETKMSYLKENNLSAVPANAYSIAQRAKKAFVPAILIAFLSTHALAGERMLSNTNVALWANAWGGAVNGAYVRLVNTCTAANPDCTWHWVNGMIVSDRNPSLAMNAYGGAAHGTYIRLVNTCTPANPDCTWHYNNGMIVNDNNPTLVINAWGGAAVGTYLRLANSCTPVNPDCTFSWGLLTK